jgi:methionyl aminopeptidase
VIEIKTPAEIESMRKASRVVAEVLQQLKPLVKPGVTTADLDKFAERRVRELGAVPAFLGYRGYPATLCVSINDEVVHGIPSPSRKIADGDVVSLDLGCVWKDYYGDAALTVAAGKISKEAARLMTVTEQSLSEALAQVRDGARLGDVCHAVERCACAAGYSVVREFTGHGIGRRLHEDPSIPNYGRPGSGITLREGMTLAIEPMICAGGPGVEVKADGWTAVTRDGSLAAHFEHTVCVKQGGCEILSSGPAGTAWALI